jgi:hypothetical protein
MHGESLPFERERTRSEVRTIADEPEQTRH